MIAQGPTEEKNQITGKSLIAIFGRIQAITFENAR